MKRAAEHVAERQPRRGTLDAGQLGHWVEPVPPAEPEYVVVAEKAALVRDVVAEERDGVVGGEQ